jgi:tetratricopeptide (TPR) repeat protein
MQLRIQQDPQSFVICCLHMKSILPSSIVASLLRFMVIALAIPARAYGTEPAKPAALYLARANEWSFHSYSGKRASIQMQELVRQGIWLTAREQFRVPVADAWLDEPPLVGQATVTVHGATSPDNILRVTADNSDGRSRNIAGLIDPKRKLGYRYTLVMTEYASRDEYEKALESFGFVKAPDHDRSDDPLPQEIERKLGEVDFVSQFLAIRELHALLAEKQSSAALGGLVRGYANLGVLSEFCLHPAHHVFKARALLYAQRLCNLTGKESPIGYWHRAYASALAGLQGGAVADLEAATKLVVQSNRPPEWVPWINAYCKYETSDLVGAKQELPAIAKLLHCLALYGSGTPTVAVEALKDLVAAHPECFVAYDLMCQIGPLGVLHEVTARAPIATGDFIYVRLGQIQEIPQSVKDALTNHKDDRRGTAEFKERPAIVAALLQLPGDAQDAARSGLSWDALGLLLREVSYAQAIVRVSFEARALAVSPDATLAALEPLYSDHPLADLVRTYSTDASVRQAAAQRLADLDTDALPIRAADPVYNLAMLNPAAMQRLHLAIGEHQEWTSTELLYLMRRMPPGHGQPLGSDLLDINPRSPAGLAAVVGDGALPKNLTIKQVEQRAGKHAAVWLALGRYYLQKKQLAESARCVERAIKLSEDSEAYRVLAEVYRQQDREELWLSTLERFLKQPSQGLEHASIHSDIADHYMQRKQWDKAWPHATQSAQTYWARGLIQAAYCAEARQDWESAEQYFKAVSERYANAFYHWYLYCRRTGQGELKEAIRPMSAYVAQRGLFGRGGADGLAKMYYLLERDAAAFMKHLESSDQAADKLHLALLHDAKKDVEARDKLLDQTTQMGSPEDEVFKEIAENLQDDIWEGEKSKLSLAKAEEITKGKTPPQRAAALYYIGLYLSQHGKAEEAVKCWQEVMGLPDIGNQFRTMAGAELVARNIPPSTYKDRLQPNRDKTASAKK